MASDAPSDPSSRPSLRIGFLGPEGTFTEEALLSEADYRGSEFTPMASLVDVLEAVQQGEVDLGFVPLENAIEGTVRDIIDSLVFEFDLRIQREVVLDIHLHLMAPPGTTLDDGGAGGLDPGGHGPVPWLPHPAPTRAELVAANSTAEAARLVGQGDPSMSSRPTAAIAPRLAATLYGLEILAEDVEDHPENQTRFVALSRSGIPAPTGHDRTSIACFQRADHPGSLYGILGQFAARDINLSKLESRPTKKALGDYCFIIDFDGHLADAVVSDCLRDLHAGLAGVKFLGSYPAAGPAGPAIRRQAEESTRKAGDWVEALRREDRRRRRRDRSARDGLRGRLP